MTAGPAPDDPASSGDDTVSPDDPLEEVRQAAAAVVASLKWLAEAAEQVLEDPEAFARVVDSGRSVVESFVDGFRGGADRP